MADMHIPSLIPCPNISLDLSSLASNDCNPRDLFLPDNSNWLSKKANHANSHEAHAPIIDPDFSLSSDPTSALYNAPCDPPLSIQRRSHPLKTHSSLPSIIEITNGGEQSTTSSIHDFEPCNSCSSSIVARGGADGTRTNFYDAMWPDRRL